VTPVRQYIVATETGPAALRAHALADLGEMTHRYSVAVCGFPAERLTIVPGLSWDGVEPEYRCKHCDDGASR
jgi:hypothetical protein